MNAKNCSYVSKATLKRVESVVASLPSPNEFDSFHEVMGLVYIETDGTVAGFELLNAWAKRGDAKVIPTDGALWACWSAYDDPEERYFGMGRLMTLSEEAQARHSS